MGKRLESYLKAEGASIMGNDYHGLKEDIQKIIGGYRTKESIKRFLELVGVALNGPIDKKILRRYSVERREILTEVTNFASRFRIYYNSMILGTNISPVNVQWLTHSLTSPSNYK